MHNDLMLGDIWSPTSPILAILCLLLAVVTAWIIQLFAGRPEEHQRFGTIDGLRGYLAFFVFLHHSSIWYYYLRSGRWETPPSNLFTNLGQASVALFFMITSFLFVTKLIDARAKIIRWQQLYISRFLRLTPLYLFVMFSLFLIVGMLSKWQLSETTDQIIAEAYKWLSFTILGTPNINGVQNTFTIVAGVTWSLAYEWLFYVSLPLLALFFGVKPSWAAILLATIVICMMLYIWHPDMAVVRCFWGGVIAAFISRFHLSKKVAAQPFSSAIALGCFLYALTNFPETYNSRPLIFLSICFILIASGANFFGLLTTQISKTLGEMAYSIYLLHGLTLFVLFNFILSKTHSAQLSNSEHWYCIVLLSPVVVFISFVTYSLIEKPCMKYGKNIAGNNNCHTFNAHTCHRI